MGARGRGCGGSRLCGPCGYSGDGLRLPPQVGARWVACGASDGRTPTAPPQSQQRPQASRHAAPWAKATNLGSPFEGDLAERPP